MSSLTKSDVGIISTVLKNNSAKTRLTPAWQTLHDSYGIGRCEGKWLYFTRNDLKSWRQLIIANAGFDPSSETLSGDRTSVANKARNEKWSTQSVQINRIYCTTINSDLVLTQGNVLTLAEVEYRVDYHDINLGHYDALMVIENLEAYIYCQSFNFPDLGKVLVAYRGHDQSVRALLNCLDNKPDNLPVYYFCDPDPAGLGIIMDSPHATHAITPTLEAIKKAASLSDRFAPQLAARTNLRNQTSAYSSAFQAYVNYMINEGVALSQEWLCSANIPLQAIRIK